MYRKSLKHFAANKNKIQRVSLSLSLWWKHPHQHKMQIMRKWTYFSEKKKKKTTNTRILFFIVMHTDNEQIEKRVESTLSTASNNHQTQLVMRESFLVLLQRMHSKNYRCDKPNQKTAVCAVISGSKTFSLMYLIYSSGCVCVCVCVDVCCVRLFGCVSCAEMRIANVTILNARRN